MRHRNRTEIGGGGEAFHMMQWTRIVVVRKARDTL